MTLSSVELAFVVGAIPSIAMIFASGVLSAFEVEAYVEACFQNFAAGLIIAAVAGELFPLMLDAKSSDSMAGITVGFVVGLFVIYGSEYLVEYVEALDEKSRRDSDIGSQKKEIKYTYPDGMDPSENTNVLLTMTTVGKDRTRSLDMDELLDWEKGPVERASLAIASPQHRRHITEHLMEVSHSIQSMERKANTLLQVDLTIAETEEIAEQIDEEIHNLQYKVDHCKRLLQGSESELARGFGDPNNAPKTSWVTQEHKAAVKERLGFLKSSITHVLEHINEPVIDQSTLEEVHDHMNEMDAQLNFFHESVESAASRWQRSRPLMDTEVGDKLPVGLVIPVVLDGFVDGFLIGVATALSHKAGIILGFANILEMAFLGMAYSSRLNKCTGSSCLVRAIALYSPALIMFLSSGVGAALAILSVEYPAFYIGFVAFGVVALLFLVCNELLIEARAAQGSEERWWISILVFIGIYVVLMVDHAF